MHACARVEVWLAGLVATAKGERLLGVNPSNTVEIGKLVIERNLRSRRKLIVEEEVETRHVLTCGYCDKPAVFQLFFDGSECGFACGVHIGGAKKNGRCLGLKRLEVV